MRARQLGRKGIVVGDQVVSSATPPAPRGAWRGSCEVAGARHGAASHGRRHRPGRAVLVANADQLVVVTALADPSRGTA